METRKLEEERERERKKGVLFGFLVSSFLVGLHAEERDIVEVCRSTASLLFLLQLHLSLDEDRMNVSLLKNKEDGFFSLFSSSTISGSTSLCVCLDICSFILYLFLFFLFLSSYRSYLYRHESLNFTCF